MSETGINKSIKKKEFNDVIEYWQKANQGSPIVTGRLN